MITSYFPKWLFYILLCIVFLSCLSFANAQSITSFSPTSATAGEIVTITGTGFIGTASVSFGGINAISFTVQSATSITAVVGNGTSGNVEVFDSFGIPVALAGFTYIPSTPFITTWVTDNGSIIIPTTGGGYNYDIIWTNLTNAGVGDGSLSGRTGNTSIFGLTNGDVYEVQITGVFPRINFGGSTFQNQQKIRSIEQWGNNPWASMAGAFEFCRNMVINAADSPDLSNVTSLSSMFVGVREPDAFTNTDLTVWDVSTITDMSYMFNFAWYFNQNINNWNVSNVTNMAYMFGGTYYYNQPLNDWDVSNVTNMELMFFELLLFDQPLDQWDVSNVQFMNGMFSYTVAFNQPLDSWDVSSVTNMQEMFGGAEVFNQPLNSWDVSSVTNMSLMFENANVVAFNQPLDNWDVSNVTEMWRMFTFNDVFNQDISGWNVGNVTDMWSMFREATAFDQNLGNWNVSNVNDMGRMLENSGLSIANYDATLIGWSSLPSLQPSNILDAQSLNFCQAETARNSIISTYGWTINDAGVNCSPIIVSFFPANAATGETITIKGENLGGTTSVNLGGTPVSSFTVVNASTITAVVGAGTSGDVEVTTLEGTSTLAGFTLVFSVPFITTWTTNDGTITIPTTGTGYNYDISWTNLTTPTLGDGAETGQTGSYTLNGLTNGDTYQILIRGNFPRINFNNGGDKDKILTVEQWGDIQWSTMETAFYGCTNLTVPASDAPDLTSALSLNQMFRAASNFNESIDHWDVSNIILFFGMFWDATSFNQPLNSWVLTNATSISNMFHNATSFNQPLSNWVTTGLTDIKVMFKNASSFNQPVNHFDVSLVTDFAGTFEGATNFDQPLNNWDMSSANSLALMFYGASSFNQDLSTWDVSSTTSMAYMFGFANSFDQDLGNWDIGQVTNMTDMLWLSNLSISNYDNTLIGWATISGSETQIPSGITSFRANGLTYCNGETARQFLIDTQNWVITLDSKGVSCPPIITSFTPNTAAEGTIITLSGSNFTGASTVSFGGTNATSFTVVSPTEITAQVASGSSGNVAVTTPNGTTSLAGFTFIPAPTITSFTPTSAASGATVTIIGTDFTGTTTVSFGGTNATNFTIVSPTEITAEVAFGASGNVEVITPGGTATLAGFNFIPAPTITSFTPTSAASGAIVNIIGTDFTGTTTVSFGGTNATNFTVVSPTEITAEVAFGASGNVEVITPSGTASLAGFTFIPAPIVDSYTPVSAAQGETVTISGSDFTDATAVSFGGTAATSFTVLSATSITAVVGNGSSGNVEVTTPGGTAIFAGFTFIPAPIVDSFLPLSAAQGETVTVTGTDFNNTTAVSFGGTAATTFTVVSTTEITAVVGNGSSGNVEVTTPGGTAIFAGFTFIPAPIVDSFLPLSAAQGETVTISGSDFTDATAVSFGGTAATSFTVLSATSITAVVGNGSSGDIEVSTPGGTAILAGFEFISAPIITSFTPTTAASGATVTIIGTNFTGTTAVTFGGTNATNFTVVSPTQIVAQVASGTSGNIEVTTPGGTAIFAGFEFIPAPIVDSFTPVSAAQGETVTISGSDFTDATAVSFGGTAATSFTVQSATTITAVVGIGSSGNIEVSTPGGTAILAGFEFISAPIITSFLPTSATQGETVTINGINFINVNNISFGGTVATSFTVVSTTEITAVVGEGTSGEVLVSSASGTATLAGFIFESPEIAVFNTDGILISHNQSNPVNLGATFTMETIEKQFTIENTGASDLIITGINSSDAAFELSNIPDILSPGTSAQFGILFNTSELGVYISEISISNNTTNIPQFIFNVSAEITKVNVIDNETESIVISDQSINLGSTFINVDIDKNFNIENLSSTSPLEIIRITVDNPVFQIINIPTLIAPAASSEFIVRLLARTVGEYSGIVKVTTNLNEFSFQILGEVLPESSRELKIYNVITPNGDGRHDFLQIDNITEYPNNKVSIYNRWGNKVFDVNNYDNSAQVFEGISNNGEELMTGNYYYVIDKGNGEKRISGFLIIKR